MPNRDSDEAGLNSAEAQRPNVVYILADDLGYGDVSCYNDDSKIPTPNLDRLASEGRRFTDAHAPSAVCTPTRYSLLTGRYCWRTALDTGVLWQWDPPLIDPDRLTVPELLGDIGYDTACIGKWHLGWEWPTLDVNPPNGELAMGETDGTTRDERGAQIDFTEALTGGPTDRGFDYYFGDDVPNFPPYTWIENDRVCDQPTAEKPEAMFGADGPMAPGWTLESVMPELTARATEYVENRAAPFFLYFSLTAPHTPIVPTESFRGRSDAGTYGDYVVEVDWAVGQIMDALERAGIAEETLVVFTSDHGDMAGHQGMMEKQVMFEQSIGVPLLLSLPDADSGRRIDHPVSQIDLVPTLLDAMDQSIPGHLQGRSLLPFLQGETDQPPEPNVVVEWNGPTFSGTRKDEWPDEGSSVGPVSEYYPDTTPPFDEEAIRRANVEPVRTVITPERLKLNYYRDGDRELYDLDADPHELENLAADEDNTDDLERLTGLIFDWQVRTRDPVHLP